MNNTTKAKYNLAASMLKGNIPIEEVVLMSGLPEEEVKKLKNELKDEIQDRNALRGLDL
ncbi:MAG: hypothetical protein IKQ49_07370 [Eubacterium sp.]|nr:hypothetical protein [Eubacterium sp.]MBR6172978.1 hypothetical protein [Eubacterium sp.]